MSSTVRPAPSFKGRSMPPKMKALPIKKNDGFYKTPPRYEKTDPGYKTNHGFDRNNSLSKDVKQKIAAFQLSRKIKRTTQK